MSMGNHDYLGQQWRLIPATRRRLVKVACWGLAVVVVWQGLWLPGQQRLEQAAARLHQERLLARHLSSLSGTSAAAQQPRPSLSAARLSERAQRDDVQVVELHSNGEQIAMSVQGSPQTMMGWVHGLEQDGAQLSEIRLQAIDDQLQARIGLVLDEG